MNPLVLAIVLATGWVLRRSVARRVEHASMLALPRGTDGIIAGAAPIDRRAPGKRAVLILHGFGDTPQTVGYLAEHLHGLGFTVRAPLLAGHGRTLRQFGESTAEQWLDGASRELADLQARYETVGVVGVSMGGALAVILAARQGRAGSMSDAGPGGAIRQTESAEPRAGRSSMVTLVLIAPYLSMRRPAHRLAMWHWLLSPFIRYLPSREEASIRDAQERRSNRGFGTVTPGLLNELWRLVRRADAALAAVTVPTLVIHSRGDNRIDPHAATRSFERLGASDKRIEWTEGGGHVITVDVGRERVFALTGEWLLARMDRAATSPARLPIA